MEALLGIAIPTIGFGIFALLALRFGAESRPWFDGRPVTDDRPNWFPIAGPPPRAPAPPPPEPPEDRGITVPVPARPVPARPVPARPVPSRRPDPSPA